MSQTFGPPPFLFVVVRAELIVTPTMKNDKRITLRPAQAAAYLGCSTATLWRWAKTIKNFPPSIKLDGQRATVWFKDELDKWEAAQEGQSTHTASGKVRELTRGRQNKEVTDLALFIHDLVLLESDFADAQFHPFLEAFLLASDQSLPVLSFETDIPLRRLQTIAKSRDDVDEDELTRLYVAALAAVLHCEKELTQQVKANPALRDDPKFRDRLTNLDRAHRLCFGQTLGEHLMNEEGRDHANA